jgi:phosphohistidine phosphatase SixA
VHGVHQIALLSAALQRRNLRPTLVLTSASPHARQTAEALRDKLSEQTTQVVPLNALTPKAGPSELDALVQELHAHGISPSDESTVLIVGHEGRLSNLLTELTSIRTRPLAHGEAVTIRATDIS